MKKSIILILTLVLSLGCLSGQAAFPDTKTQNTSTIQSTEIEPTETSLPPTIAATKKPTKLPTFTPKPPTATPDPIDQIQDRIADYNNEELNGLLEKFRTAKYYAFNDEYTDGAETTSLFQSTFDISPEEFLAIADVSYEHTTSMINRSTAGCGYVFYDDEEAGQTYFVLFTLDNFARLTQVQNEYWDGVAHVRDNSLHLSSPNGTAQIMLVLLGGKVIFAVNGKILINQTVDWKSKGYFGYSLLSGSYKDYGTRCKYKDSVLLVNK